MGPTGMPNAFMALSMEGRSTPSCTRAVTSTMKGARHLFTKNPRKRRNLCYWYSGIRYYVRGRKAHLGNLMLLIDHSRRIISRFYIRTDMMIIQIQIHKGVKEIRFV